MRIIDINCDMGEIAEAVRDGSQESLMAHVTSVNIACGGHAGDEHMMRQTVQQALRWKVAIGAHPGYPDRANFGRLELDMPRVALANSVYEQVRALAEVAEALGAGIAHVKPHGALYNQAARAPEIASAIADGVARFNRNLLLIGLAGSAMLDVFGGAGFRVAAEAFADRRYEPDGSLRPRKFADSLLCEPGEAALQALRMARDGAVAASDGSELPIICDTICIHGDTPGAPVIAEAVARTLRDHGIRLTPISMR